MLLHSCNPFSFHCGFVLFSQTSAISPNSPFFVFLFFFQTIWTVFLKWYLLPPWVSCPLCQSLPFSNGLTVVLTMLVFSFSHIRAKSEMQVGFCHSTGAATQWYTSPPFPFSCQVSKVQRRRTIDFHFTFSHFNYFHFFLYFFKKNKIK